MTLKLGFGIRNRNHGPISVGMSQRKLFFLRKRKLFFSFFSFFFNFQIFLMFLWWKEGITKCVFYCRSLIHSYLCFAWKFDFKLCKARSFLCNIVHSQWIERLCMGRTDYIEHASSTCIAALAITPTFFIKATFEQSLGINNKASKYFHVLCWPKYVVCTITNCQ